MADKEQPGYGNRRPRLPCEEDESWDKSIEEKMDPEFRP